MSRSGRSGDSFPSSETDLFGPARRGDGFDDGDLEGVAFEQDPFQRGFDGRRPHVLGAVSTDPFRGVEGDGARWCVVLHQQNRWGVLDVETTPGRAAGFVTFVEPQVQVGLAVVQGPSICLGHVELHTPLHGALGPTAPDVAGVQQGVRRGLVVPRGRFVEGVHPVQFDVGVTDAVVGPGHLCAQRDGVHSRLGPEFDGETQQKPPGVDAVPFQVAHSRVGEFALTRGPSRKRPVHTGPKRTLGRHSTALGRRGLPRFPMSFFPNGNPIVSEPEGALGSGFGHLPAGRVGVAAPRRQGQGGSHTSRRHKGKGTTHDGGPIYFDCDRKTFIESG